MVATLVGMAVLSWPGHPRAQVLPLMQESIDGETRYWWQDPDELGFTELDEMLFRSTGGQLLDVRDLAHPPAVSRLYRQSDLSVANARNLGGLYGARLVLLGGLSLEAAEPAPGEVFWLARARVTGQLLAVDADLVHFDLEGWVVGQGADAVSAIGAARQQAAFLIAERLRLTGQEPEYSVDYGSPGGPTLVMSGIESAQLLVAFKGDLRRFPGIVADVRESWATEGQIGLEVELAGGASVAGLADLLQTLALATDTDYILVVERRQDPIFNLDLDLRPDQPPRGSEGSGQPEL